MRRRDDSAGIRPQTGAQTALGGEGARRNPPRRDWARSSPSFATLGFLLRVGVAVGIFILTLTRPAFGAATAARPNFVWILSEDNSTHYLRLYGNALGITPTIERLASEGLVFEHAFCSGPVCSVARTTLMTGVDAPRAGFQFHRKARPARLPDGLKMWPAYLREAGYYTSNNAKTDYNVAEAERVWDESSNRASWRKRPERSTPFFHMQTTTVSHESSLHFRRNQMDPAELHTSPAAVVLPPYLPDTPLMRYTYARYCDRMRLVDDDVRRIVGQLEADGLLEDTFIFYFGDNGGVLPRSKGYLYESGLNVPLVIRIPERWKHLVAQPRGTRAQGFVTFTDFGPTVLRLAGVAVPRAMDGRPFLGTGISAADLEQRDEAYGWADRFDEKYDLVRSLRKGQFKYIRNYEAFYPDGLQNNYRYLMLAYAEWRELYRAGKLNAVQRQFFEARPPEMLFDLATDPHEVKNLAADPGHAAVLRDLRERLRQKVRSLPDLGFYPESLLIDAALPAAAAYGQAHVSEIGRMQEVADLALLPFEQAAPGLRAALASDQRWERYWACIAATVFGEAAASLRPAAERCLADPEPLVRLRAAEFLGVVIQRDPRPALLSILNAPASPPVALLTLNTAAFFHDRQPAFPLDPSQVASALDRDEVSRRLEYLKPSQTP